MSEEKNCTYEDVAMNTYSKPIIPNQLHTNVYAVAGETTATRTWPAIPEKKISFVTKLLIVGSVVNFVLLLVTIVILSFFLARTAAKSEVGAISQVSNTTETQETAGW